MLGWDALNTGTPPPFNFDELDAKHLQEQLLNSTPSELYTLASEAPVTVETMRHMVANRTAARFAAFEKTVLGSRDLGVWVHLLERVIDTPGFEWLMIDASYIKVHPHGGWGGWGQSSHGPH